MDIVVVLALLACHLLPSQFWLSRPLFNHFFHGMMIVHELEHENVWRSFVKKTVESCESQYL